MDKTVKTKTTTKKQYFFLTEEKRVCFLPKLVFCYLLLKGTCFFLFEVQINETRKD
jgi:hypothetical protein